MSIYSQDTSYYVYVWLRKNKSKYGIVGSPFYIGKGKNRRAYEKHIQFHSVPIKSNIVIVCDNLTEIDSFIIETILIAYYGRIIDGGCLRNLTFGGEGVSGYKHTKEAKLKISVSQKGRKDSSGTIQRKSQAQKGIPRLYARNRAPHNKGLALSDKTKNKISQTMKGKTRPIFTDAWKKNIGNATRKRYKDKEYKLSQNQKIRAGINASRLSCEYCNKNVNRATYNRCHGNKCKAIPALVC